ncbi:MAG TPA: alpha-ketoglutarate-dependent dioxygenase AlkB [Polyangiaceae bacterium]|nr:alpha-ketoglutarate-dependent dioxygenase AlkB [Polyangiaceae bacterium]
MLPASDPLAEFRTVAPLGEHSLFAELLASVRFETVGKGRQGAVLSQSDARDGTPLVRTTTRYSTPPQHFGLLHERLARLIQERASLSIAFNNALIECYTNAYAAMGAHSDQTQDLAEDSIFSCYERPEAANPPRKLLLESKVASGGQFELSLAQNSVVVFSVATNRRFKHRIVLDRAARSQENRWLGITFRTAKTFLRYREGCTYFADGTRLTQANEEQKRELYALRRRENDEVDFTYPQLTYTLSDSDLMPPETAQPPTQAG